MVALVKDKRGAILVQAILFLPILILIVVGSFEVWKAISVKQSLHSGTYQATRYLSLNPVLSLNSEDWVEEAEKFVEPELKNNGFVSAGTAKKVSITVDTPDSLDCGKTFTIKTELSWKAVIPYLSRSDWKLVDQHEGFIVCEEL